MKLNWNNISETCAVSQGQWKDNGFPIVFELVLMNDDDEFYLIIRPESGLDYWGVQKDEAIKEFGNGIIAMHSYNISEINKCMKSYTDDYVAFEWNEEFQEYFGNCV